jgi:YVTN family beta-propeller protein
VHVERRSGKPTSAERRRRGHRHRCLRQPDVHHHPPTKGTVTGGLISGLWTYAPTNAARVQAAVGAAVAMSRDDTRLYVIGAESPSYGAWALDAKPDERHLHQIIATIPLPPNGLLDSVAVSGKFVFVTDEQFGTLSVIDAATNTVISSYSAGLQPHGVAVAYHANPSVTDRIVVAVGDEMKAIVFHGIPGNTPPVDYELTTVGGFRRTPMSRSATPRGMWRPVRTPPACTSPRPMTTSRR